MIRYILICFGWCCGSSKETKTIKHKDNQPVIVSSEIDFDINEPKVIQVVSNELLNTIEINLLLANNDEKNSDLSNYVPSQLYVNDLNKESKLNSFTPSLIGIDNLRTIPENNVSSLEHFSPAVIQISVLPQNNLLRRKSVQDVLKDSGLTGSQLIRGYSCCDHSAGKLIDINLDHGTCCRKHENGLIVTESIETLDCCIAVIDDNES